ncbi:MAG: T9SS type A sorting domain-containing protein [Prolixibacteraceae bacterium]|nr:T9SS type A sorting domain-containing protein [Prolixibacteraceae bacterium]
MDVYSQPNIHIAGGRNKLDYYGSGDVNNDEVRNETDVQLIREGGLEGLEKARADVSGEGELNEEDAQILEDYINGNRNYLPGNWDELNLQPNRRELRIDWVNKRFKDYLEYMSISTPCLINSMIIFLNFTGIKNFKDCEYFGAYGDYEDYKDKIKYGVGYENIPMGIIQTKIKNSNTYHAMPVFFCGSNEENPETSLNFENYFVIDYLNGKKVNIGDPYMDENGPAIISALYYDEKEDTHKQKNLVYFQLNEGIASYEDKVALDAVLTQNPYHLNLNLTLEENISSTIDLKEEPHFSEVLYETNADPEYTEVGLAEKIDTFWINEVEYDLIRTTSGKINQICFFYSGTSREERFLFENYGRHVIADTIRDTIHVRDLTPPEFASSSENIGYNVEGKEITPENFGYPEVTDNSGLPVEVKYLNTEIVSENEDSVVYRMNVEATDWKGQSSTGYKEIIEEKDNIPPTGNLEDITLTYREDGANLTADSTGIPVATDDSGAPVEKTFNRYDLIASTKSYDLYMANWTLTDWAGNSTGLTQRVKFEKPVSSNRLGETAWLKYYPNPVSDFLNVEYSSAPGNRFHYEIYNLQGSMLCSGKVYYGNKKIGLSQLTAGNYLVRFSNTNGYRKTIIILKKE